jgi:hypothetical protein
VQRRFLRLVERCKLALVGGGKALGSIAWELDLRDDLLQLSTAQPGQIRPLPFHRQPLCCPAAHGTLFRRGKRPPL